VSERVDRCETCRFWEAGEGIRKDPDFVPMEGCCKRYPDKSVLATLEKVGRVEWEFLYETQKVVKFDHDWCGEWKPAQTADNVITISYLG